MRSMKYDRASNVANAVPFNLELNGSKLNFYRLDDGVMGGLSNTHQDILLQSSKSQGFKLAFAGTINTNGGGFTSIRSELTSSLPVDAKGIKLKYRGDGKTYKVLLSNGVGGGPFSKSPSWQMDLPTERRSVSEEAEEATLLFEDFLPSFGGRSKMTSSERAAYQFVNSDIKQIGLMLSLQLSNGGPNPIETFGSGIFDFRLELESIELV